jgi:hypothetical protein
MYRSGLITLHMKYAVQGVVDVPAYIEMREERRFQSIVQAQTKQLEARVEALRNAH